MAYDDRVRWESWEMPTIDVDLWIVIVYTLVTVATIYLPVVNETIIRSALGLGMILFVPGYSLIAALFPGDKDIDWIERLGLSFGLSIAVSSLVGLALNFTPWGIRLDPIVICLTLFAIVCTAVAEKRRHELKSGDQFNVDRGKVWENCKVEMFPDGEDRLDRVLTVILVLAIIATISTFAYVIMFPNHGERFTEFFILGPDGANNYPKYYQLGDSKPVTVGVINHEYRSATYGLVVALNDSIKISHLYSENFTLGDNQTWEKLIEIKPDRAGNNMKLEFLLFMDGNKTAPYRESHIWINVTSR
jgi:uncharacterized membrane protein